MSVEPMQYVQLEDGSYVKIERDYHIHKDVVVPLEIFLCHDACSIDGFIRKHAFGALAVSSTAFELVGHHKNTEVELSVRGILSSDQVAALAIPEESVPTSEFTLELGHVLGRRVETSIWARTREEAKALLAMMAERLDYHHLELDPSEVEALLEAFASLGKWFDPEFIYHCTPQAFIANLDYYLVYFGHIEDTTGTAPRCPICDKSGTVSSPKHHVCLPSLLMLNKGTCQHCEQPAQTIVDWQPVCTTCAFNIQEQKDHGADY